MWGTLPHAPALSQLTCRLARSIGLARVSLRILAVPLHQREPSHAAATPCLKGPWQVDTLQPATGSRARHRLQILSISPPSGLRFILLVCCLSSHLVLTWPLTHCCRLPTCYVQFGSVASAPTASNLHAPVEKVGACPEPVPSIPRLLHLRG